MKPGPRNLLTDVTGLLVRLESAAPAGDAQLKKGSPKAAAHSAAAHGEAH